MQVDSLMETTIRVNPASGEQVQVPQVDTSIITNERGPFESLSAGERPVTDRVSMRKVDQECSLGG